LTGRTKKQVAAELVSMINAAKVWVTHDEKQVTNKIAHIEKSFCCDHDWANTEMGQQGLKENDPRAFDDAMRENVFFTSICWIFLAIVGLPRIQRCYCLEI
jgi:hypothetical protein